VGVFDVTARRAAKREPVGFFRWALPRLDPGLAFAGWLDARTAPPPPETELTCDALAEFTTGGKPEEPWIIVAEFQTEPRNDDLERVLEYRLWRDGTCAYRNKCKSGRPRPEPRGALRGCSKPTGPASRIFSKRAARRPSRPMWRKPSRPAGTVSSCGAG
jgi:hypothetical protein